MSEPAAESLAELRKEIDRIDSGMHALLMERGRIIDSLIKIKARQACWLEVTSASGQKTSARGGMSRRQPASSTAR